MKDFTGWKYYTDSLGANIGILFVSPNGACESRSLLDPEVVAWLAAGGVPLPA